MSGPTADVATAVIAKPAPEVFDFMSDPHRLDLWSFGTWRVEIGDDGLVKGTAIYDGSATYVRIDPEPGRLLIDYAVGAAPDRLVPRISARVTPGEILGLAQNHSMLSIVALRTARMDDTRWKGLISAHAFEATLIKAILESGFDHRTLR